MLRFIAECQRIYWNYCALEFFTERWREEKIRGREIKILVTLISLHKSWFCGGGTDGKV